MIRVPGEQRRRAVELLGQENPHDLVRPGHPPQRDGPARPLPKTLAKPVRTPDHDCQVLDSGIGALPQMRREIGAVEKVAALVEDDRLRASRQARYERIRLRLLPKSRGRSRPFRHFKDIEAL